MRLRTGKSLARCCTARLSFIGSVVGALVSVLTQRIDDKLIETALTVVVAYGSFLLAEHFHASGVIATVVPDARVPAAPA